jgi:hypothetical protein
MKQTGLIRIAISICIVLAIFIMKAGAAGADLNAGIHALNTRTDLALSRTDSNWSHGDRVAFANFVKLFHEDMTQTVMKQTVTGGVYRGMTWKEENPTLNPIADNSELMRVYEVVAATLLGKRWSELANPTQRTLEIIAANLIEVHALNYSQESWRLTFGFDF